MSSTNKTENIRLNSWLASDKPKREDFNYDNEQLETVLTDHFGDSVSHITQEERSKWNNQAFVGLYFGNGSATRTINTQCPFTPKGVILFASNKPPVVRDNDSGRSYQYQAFATTFGSTYGLTLTSDGNLQVTNTISPTFSNEYVNLNEGGTAYCFLMFR